MSNLDVSNLAGIGPGKTVTIVTEKSSSGLKWGKIVLIAIFILAIIIMIIVTVRKSKQTADDPPTDSPSTDDPPVVKLARPTRMGDCGYPNRPRGWYDTKKRGVRNDFCRHVGDWPGRWVCNVQGAKADGSDSVEAELQYSSDEPFDPYQNTMQGFNCQ